MQANEKEGVKNVVHVEEGEETGVCAVVIQSNNRCAAMTLVHFTQITFSVQVPCHQLMRGQAFQNLSFRKTRNTLSVSFGQTYLCQWVFPTLWCGISSSNYKDRGEQATISHVESCCSLHCASIPVPVGSNTSLCRFCYRE